MRHPSSKVYHDGAWREVEDVDAAQAKADAAEDAAVATAAAALEVALSLFRPYRIEIDPLTAPFSQSSWNTFTVEADNFYYGRRTSTGQDATIAWVVELAAGEWELELMHQKAPDKGIYTVTIQPYFEEGTAPATQAWGTIQGYDASGVVKNQKGYGGGVVATAGRFFLRLTMATKHASSSDYRGSIQKLTLNRIPPPGF